MKKQHTRLIVLSVPFKRLVKHCFSIPFISSLPKEADLVVVAPFEMGQENRNFFHLEKALWICEKNKIGRVARLLLSISDLMRRFGYWEKHKNSSLQYYAKTKYMEFKEDGETIIFSIPRRLIYKALALLGRERNRWLVLEKMLTNLFPRNQHLVELASSYKEVTLIQSANWGVQDRGLARLSEKYRWNKFLLPYTTDQIYTNGFLFTDYDGIFVQGPFEKDCATKFHNQPEINLIQLGNSWFRNVDYLLPKFGKVPVRSKKRVLYAGVSQLFYSLETELKVIELIHRAVGGSSDEYEIVYRPVLSRESQKKYVSDRLSGLASVSIDWPDLSIIALDDDSLADYELDLQRYLVSLQSVDLFIMSYLTSMSLDVSYLSGCRVVSNMIDDSGYLAYRNTEIFPTSLLGENLLVLKTYDDLSDVIATFMSNDYDNLEKDTSALDLWDYSASEYSSLLRQALEGVKG